MCDRAHGWPVGCGVTPVLGEKLIRRHTHPLARLPEPPASVMRVSLRGSPSRRNKGKRDKERMVDRQWCGLERTKEERGEAYRCW
jgi:hypothetical protein